MKDLNKMRYSSAFKRKLGKSVLSGIMVVSMIPCVATPLLADENNQPVEVKKQSETALHLTFETIDGEFVSETTVTTTAMGDGAWTFMLGTDYQLPEAYQLAEGVDQVTNIDLPFGTTGGHTIIVEPVEQEQTVTTLNVTFETIYGEVVGSTVATTTAVGGEGEAWTFMLGTDFELPEGYQLATGVDQTKNVQVPFGATGGHTVIVEPVEQEQTVTTLNVTFETIYGEVVGSTVATTTAVGGEGEAWTFMLGTDFELPEGYQLATGVDQTTNIQIPFGATGGHTMIVEPIPAEQKETVLHLTFETKEGEKVGETTVSTTAVGADGEAWTFMLGTDFELPEGYQLAEGVDQVRNIDIPFGATGGHTMIVEKIEDEQETYPATLKVNYVLLGDNTIINTEEFVSKSEGTIDQKATFVYGEDYKVVAPDGYKLIYTDYNDINVYYGNVGVVDIYVQPVEDKEDENDNTDTTDKEDTNKEENKEEAKKEEAKKNDGVNTGVATALSASVSAFAASGAAIVALLRKKRNSK